MKHKIVAAVAAALLLCSSIGVWAWGVWGHEHIGKGAIMALPKEMGLFFYNHSDFIVTESTVPDVRKHLYDKAEGPRHYIDLEWFNYTGRAGMPKTMDEAIAKYGKDSLNKYGILPWHIQDMMARLTDAMKNKRKSEILFLASDLSHYVADAHMPLHTSLNHDGQLTGQVGIHAFWEAQLPELFGKNYNLYTGEAHYIKNVEKATWDILDSSHALVNTLLRIESKMRKDNPEDKQYAMGADGAPLKNKYGQRVHAYEYAHVYHELLNGMVEEQMKAAIIFTSDFWYTAWVNAGKPDLTDLDPDYITEKNQVSYQEDLKAWKKGKVRGIRSDREF
jgi:hypothetical protein